MKAQRRHELKENVLAHELVRLKDVFNRYGNWITGAVAAIVIVVALVFYWHGRGQRALADEDARFNRLAGGKEAAPDERLNGMADLADNAKNPVVGASAAIWLGDYYSYLYIEAMRKSPPDPTDAREKAEKFYRLVIGKYAQRKLFVAKAHFGLAVLAQTAGDYAAAEDQYKQVTALLDATYPVSAEAAARLRTLPSATQPVKLATTTQATTTRAATAPVAPPGSAPARPAPPTRPGR